MSAVRGSRAAQLTLWLLLLLIGAGVVAAACSGGDSGGDSGDDADASAAAPAAAAPSAMDADADATDQAEGAKSDAAGQALPADEDEQAAAGQAVEEAGPSSADASAAATVEGELTDSDDGDFVLSFVEPSESYRALAERLIETGAFETVVTALNNQLLLPRNIDVIFQECDTINAFCDPDAGAITMCYEIVDWLVENFALVEEDPEAAFARGLDAAVFILNHEVGHAVIHQLQLPTTGKEEDAVDELASIIVMESFPGGEAVVLNAAQSFLISGLQVTDISELDFADEHSLDQQRFFGISCLVYGRSPDDNQQLLTDGTLSEDRAALCEEEYPQKLDSWSVLLLFEGDDEQALSDIPDEEYFLQDAGDFVLGFAEPESANLVALADRIIATDDFTVVTQALNETVGLPGDIPVTFRECGEINAFYDPDERAITMCYDLFEYIQQQFADGGLDDDEAFARALDANVFIFYHEVGHALINVLELPTTGKEEDAVDDLATIILIESFEGGDLAVLNAAQSFFLSGSEITDLSELDFADEHSLDSQRFFAISCLVYGSNPTAHASLVEDGTLGEERAALCEQEYPQKLDAWLTLLDFAIKFEEPAATN